MPGNYQLSIDEMVKECAEVQSLGIGGVILFGLPETKDEMASGRLCRRRHRAAGHARDQAAKLPQLLVMTDVCNCEYTSHGHCGKIVDGDVDNDETLEVAGRTAVSHARAGADIVAPSDMMDGRVAAIRAGARRERLSRTPPSSPTPPNSLRCFTGRSARRPNPTPQFGDRRSYQMDPANGREAMREIELDLEEGADMIMVKPAHAVSRPDLPGAPAFRRADSAPTK